MGVFTSSIHLGTEMQSCKEEGPPAHTNITFSCVKGTVVLTFVRHITHAKWRGSGLSCLNLPRSKAAIPWDPVGLLPAGEAPGRWEWNGTGLLSKVHWEANTARVSCGQSWGGLSGGLWDNLWPYGFGLEVRRAYHFRYNHLWTCVCRQSWTLKTQRMGNSRGLSFKIDFCDPLIVRYCKVTLRVS